MNRTKDVRELQFSSTQLIVLFLAILVLGIFIFLLGVSVGKKQAGLTMQANMVKPSSRSEAVKPQVRLPESPAEQAPAGKKPQVLQGEEKPRSAASPGESLIKQEIASHEKNAAGQPSSAVKKPAATLQTATKTAKPAPQKGEKATAPPPTKTTTTSKPITSVVPPVVTDGYYAQLGAFEDLKSAQDFSLEIKRRGFPIVILNPLPTDKKPWYRVRLGGYASKSEAEQAVQRLNAVFNKTFEYFIAR